MRNAKILLIVLITVFSCLPVEVLADGYSKLENQRIWQLRVDASHYAAQHAVTRCSWKPQSPTVPADMFPTNYPVAKEILFRKVMAMLRLDQNARAILSAFGNEESAARVVQVDENNLPVLKGIVATYGFPTVEEVGEVGANAMLMLVAHADKAIEFQKETLRTMEDEAAEGQLRAVYPLMLKTIRPKLAGATELAPEPIRSNGEPKPSEKASSSDASACYHQVYNNALKSFIRSRYKQDT